MELEDIDRTCSLRAIDYSANPTYYKLHLSAKMWARQLLIYRLSRKQLASDAPY
ncbi:MULTISPECIES: hypothetical protein [unclassified Microcoleus]|uniref:hypothetical protein n=1 Tax=unclassified Microcoleus TaxID=2642155 RepID=UPI002FD65BAB